MAKSEITKMPNAEENSKRKVLNQNAKLKAQTYQTNEFSTFTNTKSGILNRGDRFLYTERPLTNISYTFMTKLN